MKKNRVFVGVENIAGCAYYVAKALRSVGIEAKSFVFNEHPFGYEQDVLLKFLKPKSERSIVEKLYINKYTFRLSNSILRLFYFFKYLTEFDTFFFISFYTFSKNNYDLTFLRLIRKKVHFLFVGCPERNPDDLINMDDKGFCKNCSDDGLKKHCFCDRKEKKKSKIEFIAKHADIIFAQRDTSGYIENKTLIKKAFVISEVTKKYRKKFNNLNKVIISHLPSNKLRKGTKFVEQAISKLNSKNFLYISKKMSHKAVLSTLKKTNILIDQFGSGHGLLAVEAMAWGCVVICRLAEWYKEDYPDLPIISCEPEELKEVLEELINNLQKMREIGERSIEYFNKYHSLKAAGNYYKKVLNLN